MYLWQSINDSVHNLPIFACHQQWLEDPCDLMLVFNCLLFLLSSLVLFLFLTMAAACLFILLLYYILIPVYCLSSPVFFFYHQWDLVFFYLWYLSPVCFITSEIMFFYLFLTTAHQGLHRSAVATPWTTRPDSEWEDRGAIRGDVGALKKKYWRKSATLEAFVNRDKQHFFPIRMFVYFLIPDNERPNLLQIDNRGWIYIELSILYIFWRDITMLLSWFSPIFITQ